MRAARSPLIAQHIIRRSRQFMHLFQSFATVPSIELQYPDGKWDLKTLNETLFYKKTSSNYVIYIFK